MCSRRRKEQESMKEEEERKGTNERSKALKKSFVPTFCWSTCRVQVWEAERPKDVGWQKKGKGRGHQRSKKRKVWLETSRQENTYRAFQNKKWNTLNCSR